MSSGRRGSERSTFFHLARPLRATPVPALARWEHSGDVWLKAAGTAVARDGRVLVMNQLGPIMNP